MASTIKPITVWGQSGPNPAKIHIILKELGIDYNVTDVPFSDVKNPEYTAINPNGRLPSIHDPNTDITLWETGAIIEYLIEHYDKSHRYSFAPGTPESYHAKQWLFFQVSGQGPYYGQAAWFVKFHPEKIPSAIERYVTEANRITGVLESHLTLQEEKHGKSADGPWLVGNKLSFADLSFVSWQRIIALILEKDALVLDNYPHVKEWLGKLNELASVKQVLDSA